MKIWTIPNEDLCSYSSTAGGDKDIHADVFFFENKTFKNGGNGK